MDSKLAFRQPRQPILSRILTTFLVLGFVNLAQGNPGKTTPEISKAYQACLVRSNLAFTPQEKAQIFAARADYDSTLAPLRNLTSPRSKQEYDLALARLINKYQSLLNLKTFAALEGLVTEANLKRFITLTAGLNNRAYLNFHASFSRSIFEQKEVNLEKFEKERLELISQVIVGSMRRNDEAMGLTVPLSMSLHDRDTVASAIATINSLSEMTLRGQSLNTDLRKDRRRHLRARVRQAAFGVGGFAVLVGTIYAGPIMISGGGAVAQGLAMPAIIGEMGGGALLGSAGGAAAEGTMLAYKIVSGAYYQSLELGTPFSCELQKAMNQEDLGGALVNGAGFGGALGVGGTALAAIIPKITLWLMGGAVVVGQANELVSMSFELYQMKSYYTLAQELTDLENVPSNLRRDQENLIRSALTKARVAAKKSGQDAVEALIIGTLSKQFFFDGDFYRAMQSGTQLIKSLTASSADTLPSVAYSVGGAAAQGIDRLQNPPLTGSESDLFARAEKLKQMVKGEISKTPDRLELKLN